MKISTGRFKEAVNKSIKGAGFNNLIPLTGMIGIKLENGQLKLLSTDMINTLEVIIDKVAGEDVSFTIQGDTFSKLISKITSDDIELILNDAVVTIKANGTYKIPLVTDENGLVEFPEIKMDKYKKAPKSEIFLTSIMSAYNINRSSLAKIMDQPELTGYYAGDRTVTTDGNVICINDLNLNIGTKLISPQMMSLLTLNSCEKIEFMETKNNLIFITSDIIIEGPVLEGIDDYPIEGVESYLDEAFPSSCKVPKDLLISVLDRLSLFIEPYDKNGAYFAFGRKGITIHSKKDASTEIINYVDSKNFESFSCCVDIPLFKDQLLANPDDTIELWYGNENALKIVSGKITQIIALLEDDTIEA